MSSSNMDDRMRYEIHVHNRFMYSFKKFEPTLCRAIQFLREEKMVVIYEKYWDSGYFPTIEITIDNNYNVISPSGKFNLNILSELNAFLYVYNFDKTSTYFTLLCNLFSQNKKPQQRIVKRVINTNDVSRTLNNLEQQIYRDTYVKDRKRLSSSDSSNSHSKLRKQREKLGKSYDKLFERSKELFERDKRMLEYDRHLAQEDRLLNRDRKLYMSSSTSSNSDDSDTTSEVSNSSDEFHNRVNKLDSTTSSSSYTESSKSSIQKPPDPELVKFLSDKDTYSKIFHDMHYEKKLNEIPILFNSKYPIFLFMDGKTIDGDECDKNESILTTRSDQEAMQIFKILYSVINNTLNDDDYENYKSIIDNFIDFLPETLNIATQEHIMAELNKQDKSRLFTEVEIEKDEYDE
jgi:hypothetical protein